MWMCIYLYIVYRDMLDTFGYYKNVWKDKRSLPVPPTHREICLLANAAVVQLQDAPSSASTFPCSAGCVRPILWPSEVNHDKSWRLDVPYFLGKPHKPNNHCWVASIYTTRTRNKIGRFTNQNGEILHRWELHVGNQMLVSMPIINDLRSSAMLDFNIFNRIPSGKLT